MGLSVEQLDIALQIDGRMRELEQSGANEVTIFVQMSDLMPSFKQLMDTAGQHGMWEELCAHFEGFFRYAKILEKIAAGIQSVPIKVPR